MSRDLIQVCSDNETPFTLPEPVGVDDDVTAVTPGHCQQQQQQQQVLESRDQSRDQPDHSAAVTPTNGIHQSSTLSGRMSSVKVSVH